MNVMNISDVFTFNKVAKTLSFTKAARLIGSSRSAVSKRISRLEEDLGVMLINRSTRSVNLTEAGRIFHQHTSELDSKIERAADVVRAADERPSGTVKFSVPSSLGTALMPALLTQVQSTWPDLRFDIHFHDRVVDLIAGGFDLAIQISQKLDDSNLISRRLATSRRVLAAAPGYLEQNGVPTEIAELKEHRCLSSGVAAQTVTSWRLQDQDSITEVACASSISANNNVALVLAACLDHGIIYLPEICMYNELLQQRLQIILPEASDPEPYGIYAVYPHRNAAAKVTVLVDFIEQQVASLQSNS
jgi:DNA-binding transcriptional LysR family regulator